MLQKKLTGPPMMKLAIGLLPLAFNLRLPRLIFVLWEAAYRFSPSDKKILQPIITDWRRIIFQV